MVIELPKYMLIRSNIAELVIRIVTEGEVTTLGRCNFLWSSKGPD